MRKARVIYNEKEDAFELQINTGDGWGMSKRYMCRESLEHPEIGKEYISWRIIADLAEAEAYGYKITFRN